MRENYNNIAAQAVYNHTGTYPTNIENGPEKSFWAQTFIVDGKYFVKMTNNPKKGENSMVEVPITQHLRRFGIPVALALKYFPEDAIADGHPVTVIYEYFGDISGRQLCYQGYSIAGVDKMVNNVNGYHQLGTTNIDFLPHYKLSQREMLILINASNLAAGVKKQSLAAFDQYQKQDPTILHCDLYPPNILFHKSDRVGTFNSIIDWEKSCIGPRGLDYFGVICCCFDFHIEEHQILQQCAQYLEISIDQLLKELRSFGLVSCILVQNSLSSILAKDQNAYKDPNIIKLQEYVNNYLKLTFNQ
jgi:hypothetical protein